jgi:hypothetical protein
MSAVLIHHDHLHSRVHRAHLQLESGQNPDHAAVDEPVAQLNDEQY